MNEALLQALLSHKSRGFNVSQNRCKEDEELEALGYLEWHKPSHSIPGFYDLTESGRDVIRNAIELCENNVALPR